MIAPGDVHTNRLPPPVLVESVVVDGNPVPHAGAGLELPPGRGQFEFHYTALSFIAPGEIRFKYRLDGYDEDWVDAGGRRTAYYTNMPPGDYRFQVIAANRDGVWNTAGASLAFTLQPHLYQMKLFYAACALDLAAANKELEAFSYTVSHDLRAPLRAMQAFSTSVLADSGELLNDKGRHRLGRIQANAQNMSRLVDGLLAFSRLGRKPLDKRSVAVGRVVRRALDELSAEREGRRVDISVGELPDCQADPALLRQVFVNLLDNALKFTGKREVARIEIGCQTVNGEHRYFIKDNGAGFDMRYADKLFGVFQRLHSPGEYEGTGVGLANVQRIVHRHGGRVWAEAEVDQGATFYFTVRGSS